METEEIVETFNKHLKEMERGLSNVKQQLGDEWKDAKQMAVIRLMKYNDTHGIDESNAKNLYFITLRNVAFNMLRLKKRESELFNSNYDITTSPIAYDDEEYSEVVDNMYKDKLIELIGEKKYKKMVEDYAIDKTGKSLLGRMWRAKKKLGSNKSYYVLTWEGNSMEFEFKQDVAEYLETSNLSKKIQDNGFFTLRNVNYRLERKIGTITKDKNKDDE